MCKCMRLGKKSLAGIFSTCWVGMSVKLAHKAKVAKLAPVVPALLACAADLMYSRRGLRHMRMAVVMPEMVTGI